MQSPESQTGSKHIPALVVSLVAVVVVAALGGLASANAADAYGQLEQPSWSPPSSVFGPAWGILYFLMAVAAWLIWRSDPRWSNPAIITYVIQLVLNLLWTPLFFALELRGLALIDIIMLDVLVIATIMLFFTRSRTAGVLLLPYLAWILFATALNGSIWWLNNG